MSLGIAATLTFLFFICEIVFGYTTNSMSLIADAFHMISDFIALLVALYAIRVAKKPREKNFTFGWIRAEVIIYLVYFFSQ